MTQNHWNFCRGTFLKDRNLIKMVSIVLPMLNGSEMRKYYNKCGIWPWKTPLVCLYKWMSEALQLVNYCELVEWGCQGYRYIYSRYSNRKLETPGSENRLLLTEHLSTTSQPAVPTRLRGEDLMLPVLHVQWDCTIGGEHQHYETFIGCWQICPSSSAERETPLLWKVNKSSLVRIR